MSRRRPYLSKAEQTGLLTRGELAGLLDSIDPDDYGIAGDEVSDLEMLTNAWGQVKETPSLFCGDPQGDHTYEEPILAVALKGIRDGLASNVGLGAPGEGLRNAAIVRWALTAIHAWKSRGDLAAVQLAGMTPKGAKQFTKLPVRMAVIGDAGFSGRAQDRVMRAIAVQHARMPFDLLVHLGDTYFAGSEKETLIHLLTPLTSLGISAISLCGNHDLYYGPAGYLATLKVLRQPGRYFAIEAPGWSIACLDTALGSERMLRDDGCLDDGQLEWLDRFLDDSSASKRVLMSHHFIVSDWAEPAETLSHQLRDRLGEKVFAWYWAHEHSMVAYSRANHGFYGACVGNGAFLEKRRAPRSESDRVTWAAPGRCTCYRRDGPRFWPHGFLELELREDSLIETYHFEGGKPWQRLLHA